MLEKTNIFLANLLSIEKSFVPLYCIWQDSRIVRMLFYNYLNMLFVEKIKPLQEKKQMPQRKFAAGLEIDSATYWKIERGKRRARKEYIPVSTRLQQTDRLLTFWLANQVMAVADEKELSNKVLNIAKKINHYINIGKRCYNALAEEYQARYNTGEAAKHLVPIIDNALKDKIKKDNYRILELGCGTGNLLEEFKKLDENRYDLYAFDYSKEMIKYAREKCPNASIVNKNVLTIGNDINSLPFEEKDKFDIIIMVALIHLFPRKDAEKLLKNIKGLLNPNGLIYIDTTLEMVFRDGLITDKQGYKIALPRLRTYWTEESFEKFLDSCGFEIIKDYSDNNKSNRGKIWLQRIAKIK
jgi:SAM-dependent methyltransferase/DNA-binding XRE family transcriptional regulator